MSDAILFTCSLAKRLLRWLSTVPRDIYSWSAIVCEVCPSAISWSTSSSRSDILKELSMPCLFLDDLSQSIVDVWPYTHFMVYENIYLLSYLQQEFSINSSIKSAIIYMYIVEYQSINKVYVINIFLYKTKKKCLDSIWIIYLWINPAFI